jgi:CRISPR-associated endonuclease Cas1
MPLRPRRGVLALSGYGLRLAVDRGHLTVTDGAGRARRSGRFSRVTPNLKRVVIHGTSGTVSLDALAWLHATGAHLVQVDHDGRLISVTAAARLNDARLRRAQALALTSGLAVELARDLIAAKIEGQADTLSRLPSARATAEALRETVRHVRAADSLDRIRYIESRAALAYWGAWAAVELRFPTKDRSRIPEHWQSFRDRRSPLTDSARRAVSPLNALLNYCYGIAAAEARIAVTAAGCDPGIGVLHADRQGRDSFVYDVLEPIRPQVDAFVLRLAQEHTFTRTDFFENRDGVCRVMPPLSHRLSETAGQWAELLHPLAHRLARRFERAGASGQGERIAGSRELAAIRQAEQLPALLRARKAPAPSAEVSPDEKPRCRRCGTVVETKRRKYCPACISALPAMASEYARQALRKRQREDSGAGPSAETRQLMGDARSRRAAEIRAWEAAHPNIPSPARFSAEILPKLSGVRAQDIRDATGLSISYCRRVLRGQYVPHPMHWVAVKALAKRTRRE